MSATIISYFQQGSTVLEKFGFINDIKTGLSCVFVHFDIYVENFSS